MGLTVEILLPADNGQTLDIIDQVLNEITDRVEPSRKGRFWQVRMRDCPFEISVSGTPPSVGIAAGCNHPEDYANLKVLADAIAVATGGITSKPEK